MVHGHSTLLPYFPFSVTVISPELVLKIRRMYLSFFCSEAISLSLFRLSVCLSNSLSHILSPASAPFFSHDSHQPVRCGGFVKPKRRQLVSNRRMARCPCGFMALSAEGMYYVLCTLQSTVYSPCYSLVLQVVNRQDYM